SRPGLDKCLDWLIFIRGRNCSNRGRNCFICNPSPIFRESRLMDASSANFCVLLIHYNLTAASTKYSTGLRVESLMHRIAKKDGQLASYPNTLHPFRKAISSCLRHMET